MTKLADELRGQQAEAIEGLVEEKRGELFKLNNELAEAGKCEKSHRIPQVKREIARALTILAEKRKQS
ncbi:MAG: 50S ribosomal protein L29 [Parachlamydiales bacterium]